MNLAHASTLRGVAPGKLLASAAFFDYLGAMRADEGTMRNGGSIRDTARDERRAIALWLVAGGLYVGGEAAAALAFSPRYDYARNYISDLGVPACGIVYAGRVICSPLHGLMNLDFLLQAVLFPTAALAIARVLSSRGARAFLACAALNGLGNILVGLFPETSSVGIGGLPYHVLGAFLAILFGNGAAVASAWAFAPLGLAPLHRRASLLLPLLSAGALAMLIVARTPGAPGLLPEAVWERLSVYPITAWEVTSALCLIAARRRRAIVPGEASAYWK